MIDQFFTYQVSVHPLSELTHEMDLIYHEGPVLSVMRNAAQEPYLFYWVDRDNHHNRWLVLRIRPEHLVAYVGQRRMTLLDLIHHASDGLAYLADMDDDLRFVRVALVPMSAIPQAYLPGKESIYASEPTNIDIGLDELASAIGTDLLNVHLARGDGVEFGSASITTLGRVLAATGTLAESIAVAKFATRASDNVRRVTKRAARTYGTFQYVTERAASFSAILRPLVTELSLGSGFEKRPEEVVRTIMQLLESGEDYEALLTAADLYGQDVVNNLEELAKTIEDHNLDVDLRWVDRDARRSASVRATPAQAKQITSNIRRLEQEGSRELNWDGSFSAIDTKRRSYVFRSESGLESSGHFAEDSPVPISKLTFEQLYSVVIKRIALAGAKPKSRDIMTHVRAAGPMLSGLGATDDQA